MKRDRAKLGVPRELGVGRAEVTKGILKGKSLQKASKWLEGV